MPTTQILYNKEGKGKGGLNLADASQIPDNDFEVLKNFRRDSSKRLITRRGIATFGDDVDGKPITSYFFRKRDDAGGKIALRFSGSKIYKYNETTDSWTEIYTGLTEYESGSSGPRTRWDFDVYKNVLWGGNGIDDYLSITIPAGVVTAYPAKPKTRHTEYLQDRLAGFGEDANPITMYYSNAAPADGQNIDDNSVVIGGDEQGKGTGLKEAGQVWLAAKEKKIYAVDVATPSALPLNAKDGLYSDRAWWPAGNGTIFFSNEGLNTLEPRDGVEGAEALSKKVDSAKVNNALKDIAPVSYNSNCGYVLDNLEYDQYFFSFDSTGDDIPNKTLVRSNFTKDYSEYSIPAAYQYGQYEMDDGEVKHVIASAASGQMYEIETGFNDAGASIDYELKTKNWDFNQPETWKDIERMDFFGLKNKGSNVSVQIYFDNLLVASATIDDDNIDVTTGAIPIGVKPVGTYPISKGTKTIDLFLYKIYIPLLGYGGTTKVQVRVRAFGKNIVFTLDKATATWQGNTFDMLEQDKIG